MISRDSNTKFVERELYLSVAEWFDEPEIIAISGPRQAGKTTLLKEIGKRSSVSTKYFNFEQSSTLEAFIDSPQDFIRLELEEGNQLFLFDEFQYVPDAGKRLKILYDQFPSAKFIITGSASLRIKDIASYLVGRVVFFELLPFSFYEYLSVDFKKIKTIWDEFHSFWNVFLDQGKKEKSKKIIYLSQLESCFYDYLKFGGYPSVVLASDEKKVKKLDSLVETYIEKDVINFLNIGNFLEYKNFVRILAAEIGGLLNYSSLGSDAKLNYRQVKKYLSSLEQTFVINLLRPYFENPVTEIKKTPKSYFLDLGLRNSLLDDFRDVSLRQDLGLLVEDFVASQLFNRFESRKFRFWRTKQGAEVDFIFKHKNQIIPIEVKYKSFSDPKISRSFRSFLKTYKPQKGIVITKDFHGYKEFENTLVMFFPVYFV